MAWINLFRRQRPPESQFDAELGFHLQKLIDEKVADGTSPEEAKRSAILEFGGGEQLKEELRDVHRSAVWEALVSNFRWSLRLLRKSPSFSATVIVTLALGIGANSAVFSAVNAILLRPLPFPQADRLMVLHQHDRKAKNPETFIAPVRLEDWNRMNSTFESISGWYVSDISEASGTFPERIREALVAPRFLEVWGVLPALGRNFSSREEHFGGPRAALISDRFWRRRFQADPNTIGKQLRVDGKYSYTVIGVLPASFLFPDHDVDLWVPSPPDAPYVQDRGSTWFNGIGRLKTGVSIQQANTDLARIQSQLARQFPKSDGNLDVVLQPLKETTIGSMRRSLWILFGAVSLLLLIACTNIAALLIARTTERAREISLRLSLGASQRSIVMQLLVECFVLSLAGSALGLLLATFACQGLRYLAKNLPRAEEISLDWRIFLYTFVCSIAATILCGLWPAIRGARRNIAGELAQGGRSQVSTRDPLQWLLVGIQVALAVTLLCGAGLLLRSFQELGRVSPGFEVDHILTFRISGNWGETGDMKKLNARINRTLDELRARPSVRAVATAGALPGVPGEAQTEVTLTENRDASNKISADSRFISHGYFDAMQIPMLAGEGCRQSLSNFEGAIVNRAFVNKYLPGVSAVGRHMQLVSSQFLTEAVQIRGISADAREQGLNRPPVPTIYWCVSAPFPSPYFLLRTQGEPLALSEALRRKIKAFDPSRSVFDISPLSEHLSDAFSENRLRTILLTLFALTAVSLAGVGLYGTLSYFVAVRRREVGLCLALGARRGQIVARFVAKGVLVSLLGCVAGLGLSIAGGRILGGMLYGVSSTDAGTRVMVSLFVLSVAALASLIPAVRASRVEPMEVLRED